MRIVALIVVLMAAVTGIRADAPGRVPRHPVPHGPRFLLTAGVTGDISGLREQPESGWPWFQVHLVDPTGHEHLIESVPPPAPGAGTVEAIVAGPGGWAFVVAGASAPCTSTLYRFRLTGDGHVTGLAPVPGTRAPVLLAGLAVSPDGRRIAYTAAPCLDGPGEPRAGTVPGGVLTTLDLTSGVRRTWTADQDRLVGEIVWASDSRTLGYTTAAVDGGTVTDVTMRALDTLAPGTDLLGGRVLFVAPRDAGTVESLTMSPDGRSGYGMLRKGKPATTVLFSFTEGRPMRVTATIPPDPDGSLSAIAVDTGDRPRYACMNGIDAFGRVLDGTFMPGIRGLAVCGFAYYEP